MYISELNSNGVSATGGGTNTGSEVLSGCCLFVLFARGISREDRRGTNTRYLVSLASGPQARWMDV
jgi:hypothetical protein